MKSFQRFFSKRVRLNVRPRYDLKKIYSDIEMIKLNAKNRNIEIRGIDSFETHYLEFKRLSEKDIELRQERNKIAKKMSHKEEDISNGKAVKEKLQDLSNELRSCQEKIEDILFHIPNTSDPMVPIGSESCNIVVNENKTTTNMDIEKRLSHIQVGNKLDLFDFPLGSELAGSSFAVLKNQGVLLEQALINYALLKLKAHGFSLITFPEIIKEEAVVGTGFNPRDNASQMYHIKDKTRNLILSGTSEIQLAASHSGARYTSDLLPLKQASVSHCFRAEAGSSRAIEAGLFRLHQFTKIEMFVVCSGHDSEDELQRLVRIKEDILEELGFQFRTVLMASEELGSSAAKKYDIEVYLPATGGGVFAEVASISNCSDFQAKRLDIKSTEKTFLHTLNGTALAIPRIMIALLEYYQKDENNNITLNLPVCLHPYLQAVGLNEWAIDEKETK